MNPKAPPGTTGRGFPHPGTLTSNDARTLIPNVGQQPSSHLYYQFRHHTKRFPQNTDWIKAATDIDQWLRTGPNPD